MKETVVNIKIKKIFKKNIKYLLEIQSGYYLQFFFTNNKT